MKLLPYLFLFLFVTACTSTDRTSEWLAKAEAHHAMGHYDSTLASLYLINEDKLSTEDSYTFYRLMYSIVLQNEPEAYQRMVDMADYYEQKKDTTHWRAALNILYRNYHFRELYPQADSILQVVKGIYTRQKDTLRLLNLHTLKANLHESQQNYDSALYYIDKRIATETNPINLKHRYQRKADVLMKMKAYAQAEALLDSARMLALEEENEEYLYHLSADYTRLYTAQKRYPELLRQLKELRPYMKRKDVASHNMFKAHVFELMHREDSALYYYDLVAKSENLFLAAEALLHLSQSVMLEDEPERAYHHHQDATGYIDQVYRAYQSQAKSNAFNELKLRSEINELKISRQQHIIVILSLVFVMFVLGAGAILYIQHKKRMELAARHKQMEQENLLLKQNEELGRLREKANQLREELIRRMEIFRKVPSLNQDKPENAAHYIPMTDEDWKEIILLVNNQYENFTIRLKKEVPTLTQSDLYLCCLLKIDVSLQDIANIYNINKHSVSRRKQRLKEKFGNELLGSLTLDQFLQQF